MMKKSEIVDPKTVTNTEMKKKKGIVGPKTVINTEIKLVEEWNSWPENYKKYGNEEEG